MERAENYDPEGDWFRASAFRKRDADLINRGGNGFRQPPSRAQSKQSHRVATRMKSSFLTEAKPFVTIVQDENTKEVLGVLYDRNRFAKFQEQCAANGVDISHAELIDKEVVI